MKKPDFSVPNPFNNQRFASQVDAHDINSQGSQPFHSHNLQFPGDNSEQNMVGYDGDYNQQAPYMYTPQQINQAVPSKKSNTKLIIIVAAVIVALLLIVGIVAAMFSSSSSNSSEGEDISIVRSYLIALKDHDAEKALSLGQDRPQNKDFLTSEILEKQYRSKPISNIQVNTDRKSGEVNFSLNIGNGTIHGTMALVDTPQGRKLKTTYISTKLRGEPQGLLLYGVKVNDTEQINVFPGPLDFTSSNGCAVSTPSSYSYDGKFNFDSLGAHPIHSAVSLVSKITPKGKTVASNLIHRRIVECEDERKRVHAHCPYSLMLTGGRVYNLRASQIKFKEDISDTGNILFTVSLTYYYNRFGQRIRYSDNDDGKVNFFSNPIEITFR